MSVNIKENDALNGIAKLIPASNITLSSLPDTNIVSPQAEQGLGYDEASGRWVNYNVRISVYYSDDFRGLNISCIKGQTTITKTAPLDGNAVVFYVNEKGTWTVSAEIGATSYTDTVVVTSFGVTYPAQLVTSSSETPEGATVLPTDDIQTWLACANITDKSYTTLAEVLADRETFETLIADSNACDYMARSTTWANPNLIPKMTSNTTPSGVASASSTYSSYLPYLAFNGEVGVYGSATYYASSTNTTLTYTFPNAVCAKKFRMGAIQHSDNITNSVRLYGSNDNGTTWTPLTETISLDTSDNGLYPRYYEYEVDNDTSYTSYGWELTTVQAPNRFVGISGAKLYEYADASIVEDQDAMALIGKYDYCSSALLSNATWSEAIANSDYTFIEPLVPTMTSATTPSGEVIYHSQYTNLDAYKAFDGQAVSLSNRYVPVASELASEWYLGYKFTEPKICNKAVFDYFTDVANNQWWNIVVQGSNDNDTWTTLSEEVQVKSTGSTGTWTFEWEYENNTPYLYYRWKITTASSQYSHVASQYGLSIGKAQFYGRASKEVLVPLVPTMTSDTTPSGTVFYSAQESASNAGYMAFSNDAKGWVPPSSGSFGTSYVGYDFGTPKTINAFKHKDIGASYNFVYRLEGSNDNINYTEIKTTDATTVADTWIEYILDNPVTYRYYRFVIVSGSAGVNYTQGRKLQLYQRTVQTNIVHSCANDTIYYMDEGSPVIVATTNSDGDGVLDFSSLEDKEYTFYSSVAKDPSNLSNDFSKTIRITKSEFGGTTEMYLMPDTVKTLYWYGYINNNLCEEISTANGWSGNSMAGVTPTYNTNSILLPQTSSGYYVSGIGTKKTISGTLKAIAHGVSGAGGQMGGLVAKTAMAGPNPATTFANASDQVINVVLSSKVAIIWSFATNSGVVSALWYE